MKLDQKVATVKSVNPRKERHGENCDEGNDLASCHRFHNSGFFWNFLLSFAIPVGLKEAFKR